MKFVESYHDIMRLSNFTDIAATTACTQNKPQFIGSYKVPAGQGLELGFGPYASLDTAVGRAFMDANDSADADMNGKLRISIWDEEDRPIRILANFDLSALRQTDLTKRPPLPESGAIITQDKKLVLELICYDSGKSFKLAGSDMMLSVTKFKVVD